MLDQLDKKDIGKAQKYADKIIQGKKFILEPLTVCSVLEILAGLEDVKRFETVVNAYMQQLQRNRRIDNPYAYIEWLCRVGDYDNDITLVGSYDFKKRKGFRIVGPPAGPAQELFQKLYGEHFL